MGSILDPIADKLLLMSSFVALTCLGYLPVWLLIAVLFRDLWIMSGVLVYHYVVGDPEFTPSFISKFNTVLQLLLVTFILLRLSFGVISDNLLMLLMYVVLITSVLSLLDYTWTWGRRALKLKPQRGVS